MASTEIPSYDLTLSSGGIRSRIAGNFNLSDWWRDIIDGPYSTDLASQLNGRPLVMACLSQAYAPLIMKLLDEHCDKTEIRYLGKGCKASCRRESRVPSCHMTIGWPKSVRAAQNLTLLNGR